MLTTQREENNRVPKVAPAAPRPILWAIDPQNGVTPDVLALRFLTNCSGEDCANIQPIFVKAADRGPLPEGQLDQLREQARRFVSAAGGTGFAPAEIVIAPSTDQQKIISRLIEEAETRGAEAIAVASHGNSGPLSWWRGSFAEKLLSLSPVPVIFLPHRETFADVGERRVLFCTDFSVHSHSALRRLCRLARRAQWSLLLFHDVSLPITATCDAAGASVAGYLPSHYYADQKNWAERQAAKWQRDARSWGCEVTKQVVVGGPEPVPQLILEFADQHQASAIALSTSDNAFARWLLGSTSHSVFRANRYPVWVYGPQAN